MLFETWKKLDFLLRFHSCDSLQLQMLNEVLPKAGLVYSEKGNLSEVLCKPKIMPIKSITLEKIESMEVRFVFSRITLS